MNNTKQVIRSTYRPRPAAKIFHSRTERFAILVWHRRAGKTIAALEDIIDKAMQNPLPEPQYAYLAPLFKQAKKVAWKYLKRMTKDIRTKPPMESELSVELINGATITLYGADNPDALRGIYLDGVILDEYAQMRSELFGEVIAPTLADRGGWAVFIGTVKGPNHFMTMWNDAKLDPRWMTHMLKASESGILSPEELELIKSLPGSTEDSYNQEMECDWHAAIKGAYYGKQLNDMPAKHFGSHPWDPNRPVYLAFDIGYTDATSIWFFQSDGKTYRIIDFFSETGYSVEDVLEMLATKPYAYGPFYLPHDAKNKSFQTGKSTRELFMKAGCVTRIVASLSVMDGIQAVRATLPLCYFNTDNPNVEKGLLSLRLYQAEWDPKRGMLKGQPLHDIHSDPADAFRMFALAMNPAGAKKAAQTIKTTKPESPVSNVMNLHNLFTDRERGLSAVRRI